MREAYLVERDTRWEMQGARHEILVWLPWPMGDVIMCTPALRAIREHFGSATIRFIGNSVAREILSPCRFNDKWLTCRDADLFTTVRELRREGLTHAVLMKNSFGSALAAFLGAIPARIGYAREWRSIFLTERLYPAKSGRGRFKPGSMVDYYLGIAGRLGAATGNRRMELEVDPGQDESMRRKLPELFGAAGPLVILVPGGAFGPSKLWPSESYARTADRLIEEHKARIVISVAPNATERRIAAEIGGSSRHELVNLAERPLSLGELKALFSRADLVVSNDTGPRHMAIALERKVISLFGPNDPAWTDTGYQGEIKIVGNVPCSPCGKSACRLAERPCMTSISVEMVCEAARELLEGDHRKAVVMACRGLVETSESLLIDPCYEGALGELGLTSMDSVFSFRGGKNLSKSNLASFRSRLQLAAGSAGVTLFLKRYDRPPILVQLKNWAAHRGRRSCAGCEVEAARELEAAGINVPKVVCHGEQWGRFFERRSFLITEKIADAESLERRLPECFEGEATVERLGARRDFIGAAAAFVRRFHGTGYRHRDLYLSHIFRNDGGELYLIDLARAFRPRLRQRRFGIKDVAQLYYSAPARHFSGTDRLRFYRGYTGRRKLTVRDKQLILKVIGKARQIARHEMRHGRAAPFEAERIQP